MGNAIPVRELLARCGRSSDEKAWRSFVERFEGGIRASIRRTVRRLGRRPDEDLVGELVQEVYCRLLEDGARRIGSCRGDTEAQVQGFLGRLARNVVLDHFRAEWAAKRGGGCLEPIPDRMDRMEALADPGGDPEARLLAREGIGRFFRRCASLLPPQRRRRDLKILALALIEGCSSTEIAQALGGSLARSSVDSVLSRLRRRLEAEGSGLPHR